MFVKMSRPLLCLGFFGYGTVKTMKRDRNYIFGIAALFLAAFTWGSAYVVMKTDVDVFTAAWLVGLRFGMAGVLINLICIREWRHMTADILKHGVWMGVILYAEFYLFTAGLKYTTASRSSFIIAAYIIFIPAAYWMIKKKRPKPRDFAASLVCLAGISLILLEGGSEALGLGELLTAGSALFYAIHVVYGSLYAKKESSLLLNMVQLATGGLIALTVAALTSVFPSGIGISDLKGVAYLAVAATILPYLCSLYGQKYVRTTTSAVILSFESVFGCLGSVLVLREKVSMRFFLGACIIMLALFLSEGLLSFKNE